MLDICAFMLSSFDELAKSNMLLPLVMEKFNPISGIGNHTVFYYINNFNFSPIADHSISCIVNCSELRIRLTGVTRACLPLRQRELYNGRIRALVIDNAHLPMFDCEP